MGWIHARLQRKVTGPVAGSVLADSNPRPWAEWDFGL